MQELAVDMINRIRSEKGLGPRFQDLRPGTVTRPRMQHPRTGPWVPPAVVAALFIAASEGRSPVYGKIEPGLEEKSSSAVVQGGSDNEATPRSLLDRTPERGLGSADLPVVTGAEIADAT